MPISIRLNHCHYHCRAVGTGGGQITTLLLAPLNFETFLRPCHYAMPISCQWPRLHAAAIFAQCGQNIFEFMYFQYRLPQRFHKILITLLLIESRLKQRRKINLNAASEKIWLQGFVECILHNLHGLR